MSSIYFRGFFGDYKVHLWNTGHGVGHVNALQQGITTQTIRALLEHIKKKDMAKENTRTEAIKDREASPDGFSPSLE